MSNDEQRWYNRTVLPGRLPAWALTSSAFSIGIGIVAAYIWHGQGVGKAVGLSLPAMFAGFSFMTLNVWLSRTADASRYPGPAWQVPDRVGLFCGSITILATGLTILIDQYARLCRNERLLTKQVINVAFALGCHAALCVGYVSMMKTRKFYRALFFFGLGMVGIVGLLATE